VSRYVVLVQNYKNWPFFVGNLSLIKCSFGDLDIDGMITCKLVLDVKCCDGMVCWAWYAVSSDRYAVSSDRYAVSSDRYSVSSDRYAVSSDRYAVSSDRYAVSSDRYAYPQQWTRKALWRLMQSFFLTTQHCGRVGNRFNFSSHMPTVHSLFLFSSGLPGRCQGGTPDYTSNTSSYVLQLTTEHAAYRFGVAWVLITVRFVRLTVNVIGSGVFWGVRTGV